MKNRYFWELQEIIVLKTWAISNECIRESVTNFFFKHEKKNFFEGRGCGVGGREGGYKKFSDLEFLFGFGQVI